MTGIHNQPSETMFHVWMTLCAHVKRFGALLDDTGVSPPLRRWCCAHVTRCIMPQCIFLFVVNKGERPHQERCQRPQALQDSGRCQMIEESSLLVESRPYFSNDLVAAAAVTTVARAHHPSDAFGGSCVAPIVIVVAIVGEGNPSVTFAGTDGLFIMHSLKYRNLHHRSARHDVKVAIRMPTVVHSVLYRHVFNLVQRAGVSLRTLEYTHHTSWSEMGRESM